MQFYHFFFKTICPGHPSSQTTQIYVLTAEIIFHSTEVPLFIYPSHSFEFFSISRTSSLGIIQSIMHLLWAHYVPRTLLGVGGKQDKHLKIVLSDGKGAFSFPKKTG